MKNWNKSWMLPLVLLAVCGVSFGLLIPRLGFYMDDWRPLFVSQVQGEAGLHQFFLADTRPFGAWLYIFLFKVLGEKAILWQVTALLLRWLSAVVLWLSMRLIWPARSRETALVALLFSVYPVFKQQPISLAYTQHWVSFFLFSFSIYGMIQAVRNRRWYVPILLLSLIADGVHLLLIEYMIGLEMLRPFILWAILDQPGRTKKQRAWAVFKDWLPYLLVLMAFFIWRVFLLDLPTEDRNSLQVLVGLFQHPRYYGTMLIRMVVQDTINILVSAWYNTINPSIFKLAEGFSVRASILFWLVGLAVTVGTSYYLIRHHADSDADKAVERTWCLSVIGVGLLAIWLGHAPAWVIARQAVESGLWSDRFAFPAMLGTCLVIVGVLTMLLRDHKHVVLIVCLMCGLASNFLLRNAYGFTQSTEKQTPFYWQLKWRAPSLAQPTAILADHEFFSMMGVYPTSMAINLLYPSENFDADSQPYWFFSLGKSFSENADTLGDHIELYYSTNNLGYWGWSTDSLVVLYDTIPGQCLWVLTTNDRENPVLPELTRQALTASNMSRIGADETPGYPSEDIFGAEPTHDWCYYYEKGDLARQMGDWEQAAALWDSAASQGYSPKNAIELIPFIESLVHVGRWTDAIQLTSDAIHLTDKITPYLCSTWQRVAGDVSPSAEQMNTLQGLYDDLGCSVEQ